MDLKQLQRFAALAEAKSFARTSEVLAVSQPSVSRSIHLLEESLGVSLFDRTAQGVSLTPYGQALLPYARSILNDRARAIAAIAATRKDLGKVVRLGVMRRDAAARVPEAIARLTQAQPGLTIYIVEGDLVSLLGRLRDGSIDLAFGPRDSYANVEGLVFEALSRSVSAFVVRGQHPLASKRDWSFEDLAEAVWICSVDLPGQQAWRRMFEVRRLPVPDVAVYGSSAELVRNCVLSADLVAVMYERDISQELASGQIVRVSPDKAPFEQEVGLFRRAEVALTPEQTLVADVLRNLSTETVASWN